MLAPISIPRSWENEAGLRGVQDQPRLYSSSRTDRGDIVIACLENKYQWKPIAKCSLPLSGAPCLIEHSGCGLLVTVLMHRKS